MCGHVKYHGTKGMVRISETNRGWNFFKHLWARKMIGKWEPVFSADIFYHNNCTRHYVYYFMNNIRAGNKEIINLQSRKGLRYCITMKVLAYDNRDNISFRRGALYKNSHIPTFFQIYFKTTHYYVCHNEQTHIKDNISYSSGLRNWISLVIRHTPSHVTDR